MFVMYDYGYGVLDDQLIMLFRSGAPDIAAAKELIFQGADINAAGKDPDENILSEILSGYWWTESGDEINEECDGCENDCDGCPQNQNLNPNCGQAMVQVIRFFLDHGFDVNKKDGRYGAQCLYALVLSVFDAHMIEATKMLFDAGAQNKCISEKEGDNETPWDFIGIEGSYQYTCWHDHHLGNIYEAVYHMYLAVDEGRPYHGIDSYETVCGKRIVRIFAEEPEDGEVFFDMDLPTSRHENCYRQTLYFVFDGGVLISTQYADFWVDSILPDIALTDVSEKFPGFVGNTVKRITFAHNEVVKGTAYYGQPITAIETDNGVTARFSINFGEVEEADRAAYYWLVK